jgi:small subunit ribosomal protein S2
LVKGKNGKRDLQSTQLSARMLPMQKVQNKAGTADTVVEQMFKAGAHYGYGKSRRHPTVASLIYATKNKGDIIDLEKTGLMLEKAEEFVKGLGAAGKVILFVGTKPEAKEVVKSAAMSLGMPYVTARWIGGTFSNFTEIKKRIVELENYYKDSAEGGLDKYTKKERVVMAKKMEKLATYYTGLLGLKKTPDAVFIVDAKAEHIAATEARDGGVPVIALVNSDSNIKNIDYPIVANDSGIPSIKFFSNAIAQAYSGAKSATTPKQG